MRAQSTTDDARLPAATEPDTRTRLVSLGVRPLSMTPAQFGKLIADDTEKWAKVIRSANIKTE